MPYILNILFCCFYLSFVRINHWRDLLKALPVMLIWTVIAGAQVNIGADYPLYINYFDHRECVPETRFEPLFALITDLSIKIGWYKHGPFFVFAFINVLLVFIGGKMAQVRRWAIYYFLIITVAVIFNNQMNAVRQATAVGISFLAIIAFYRNKLLGIALVLLAMGFHYSALICIMGLWIKPITNFTSRFPLTLLLIAFASAFIEGATQNLNNWLLNQIPDFLAEEVHYQEAYTDSEYSHSTNFIYRAAKIIQIPLYWKSLILIKKNELSDWEKDLFHLGFLAFMLRNVLLLNTLTGRFSYYFWIPAIFPIYYLMRYYWNKRQVVPFIIIVLWCLVPYVAKIIVGTQNYGITFLWD